MRLLEGGNIFKNADGESATQRINQTDVKPTVAWLEKLTGLPLLDKMLGSTGRKATSGDLDLAVDEAAISKDELTQRLVQWVTASGGEPKQWVKKAGISVHFKTPINGNPKNGYVQTDFMFVNDLEFAQFILAADPNSAYSGMHRFLVLNSVGKAVGYKMAQTHGMLRRDNNEVVTKDPDTIAQMMLNPNATRDDITSVERIVAALQNDPKRDAKLADARDYFAKQGIPFDTGVQESLSDAYFLAKLRNRIVDLGMTPLIETRRTLTEGARIDHPEDLIFDFGIVGAKQGVGGLRNVLQDPTPLSVKFDGKPAIIFGRDQQGFVLTDKSAFTAKGYDGVARSPDQLEQIMRSRKGERDELVGMYRAIWPHMRNAIASGFQGFVLGDLLWTTTPPIINGYYVFTPNAVTYRVRQDSDLGRRIGQSKAGIVIHTYYSTTTSPGQPFADTSQLSNSKDVVVLSPNFTSAPRVDKGLAPALGQIDAFISKNANSINALFDPATLRQEKISDYPAILKKFINDRVRAGSYDQLLPNFVTYMQTAATSEGKRERMLQHTKENSRGLAAAFQIFLDLTATKEEIINQLDSHPGDVLASIGDASGHEGYVYASGSAPIKLVDRMRFSRTNFLRHG